MRKTYFLPLAVSALLLLTSCQGDAAVSTALPTEEGEPVETATTKLLDNDYEGEMTIDFAFGTRTGIYSGDVDDSGLPDGSGSFTTENSEGTQWTYTGEWVKGHRSGKGTTTWGSGQSYQGEFADDITSGHGVMTFPNGIRFEGEWTGDGEASGFADTADGRFYASMTDNSLVLGGVWRTGGFGDELERFQGEWQEPGNRYSRVIISGESVNFVHESNVGSKHFCDVNTFYFGHDDNGLLVIVNQYDDPKYDISLSEDGILTIIKDGEVTTCERISDSIEVPQERVAPEIGMTELEVYNSTWGAPNKKNKTTTAAGEREQWVYDDGYIYLENGVVTTIQER